jgi:SAM-dependent methyltransferase
MHTEAYAYIQQQAERFSPAGLRVLELGSHYVNGSVRPLFASAAVYAGLDRWPGEGVDITADCAEFDGGKLWDMVVTTESLEHTFTPQDVIDCAKRALRKGGRIFITAAAPPRVPHRCDGHSDDLRGEQYQNVTPDMMRELLKGWRQVEIEYHDERGDIYATAVWGK